MRIAAAAILFTLLSPAVFAAQLVVWPEQMARLWDRDVRAAGERLLVETAQGHDTGRLIASLAVMAKSPELDPVARDAVLYHYTQRLRRLPADDIPTDVLDWLMRYPPQAVTPHGESDSYLVPLFDVATAARGVANERRYRLGRNSVLAATADTDAQWLTLYADSSDQPFRRGMIAAVAELPVDRLETLTELAAAEPLIAATPLYAEILLQRGDAEALAVLATSADPAVAGQVLNSAHHHLPADRTLELMQIALTHPDPGIRGLALSHGSRIADEHPRMQHDWLTVLWSALDDPDAGSAAAMHLARALPPSALQALEAGPRADHPPRLELIRRLQQTGSGRLETPR